MRVATLAAATAGYFGLMTAVGTLSAAVIAAALVAYSMVPRFINWVFPP